MKKTYTFSEARQKFAAVLDSAARDGEVRIVRKKWQCVCDPTRTNQPFSPGCAGH